MPHVIFCLVFYKKKLLNNVLTDKFVQATISTQQFVIYKILYYTFHHLIYKTTTIYFLICSYEVFLKYLTYAS